MQLSKNFSLKEMTRSQTATRKGIDNNPTGTHQSNLVLLCQNILQPLRDYYGRPLRVSSGYRSPAELAKYIIDNLNFDQLILEFFTPDDPNSGWVHCSFNNKVENRKQFLRAYKDNGKTKYEMYSDDTFPTESDVLGGTKTN